MIYNLYDTRNNLYRLQLDEKGRPIVLGSGGQGSVFLVEGNNNIVIKALTDNEGNIIKDNKVYRQYELDMLKVVALEHINYLARPLIMLQAPYCGYVMLFMNGLEPIVNSLLPRKFAYSFIKAIEDITYGCLETLLSYKKEIDKINEENTEELNEYLDKIKNIKPEDIDQKRVKRKKNECKLKEIDFHECFVRLNNYEKNSKQFGFLSKYIDGNIQANDSTILEYFNNKAIDYSKKVLYALIRIYLRKNPYDKTSNLFYDMIKHKLHKRSIVGAFINNTVSLAKEKQKTLQVLSSKMSEMEINRLYYVNDNPIRNGKHELWNFIALTGGLKKRYSVLLKTAKILRNLYIKGLVYGDISPTNIFVSERSKDYEVWFIDTDNLRYASKTNCAIGTPTYRAPEIARNDFGARNTFYSDWYSFAILAYEYLTLSKPFMGKDYYKRSEDSSWDDGLDAGNEDVGVIMEKGELAYVDDPEDKTNEKCCGLDIELVMTEKIRKLFRDMFSLKGRNNPKARPNIVKWCDALEEAELYLKLKKCENGHSFFGTFCPMCSGRLSKKANKYFRLSAEKYVYELDEDEHYKSLLRKEPFFDMNWSWPEDLSDRDNMKIGLPRKIFEPLSNSDDIVYDLSFDQAGLIIKKKAGKAGYRFVKKRKDGQSVDTLTDINGLECIIIDKKANVPISSFLVEEDLL